MDKETFSILHGLENLRSNLVLVELESFENEKLLEVKKGRNFGEYCWTCTASLMLYLFEKEKLSELTYLDSDICFFSSLKEEFVEIRKYSVFLTKHNYHINYDQSNESGLFCVQFVTFKNDDIGLRILKWWVDRTLEWCFDRHEDGKFGDQKYLDSFPSFSNKVGISNSPGLGVGPWNALNFEFQKDLDSNQILIKDLESGTVYPLIFYHFHEWKLEKNNLYIKTDYIHSQDKVEILFNKYKENLDISHNFIAKKLMLLETTEKLFEVSLFKSSLETFRLFKYLKNAKIYEEELSYYQGQKTKTVIYFEKENVYDYSLPFECRFELANKTAGIEINWTDTNLSKRINELQIFPSIHAACSFKLDDLFINNQRIDFLNFPFGSNASKISNGEFLFLGPHGFFTIRNSSSSIHSLKIKATIRTFDPYELSLLIYKLNHL